jgi:Spy/CpxP family protein refolding chaperone
MNFFHRNRLIFWVLIILVVINISALISFFIFTKPPAPAPCCSPAEQQCIAFRDELSLSATQTLQVAAINKIYKESAEPVANAIKETRAAILTELEKDSPDSLQLNALTNQLALLQMKIQKENITQYRALKHVCTTDQALKLSALYRDLYGCPMQHGQMKHRYRHGQGDSRETKCE